MQGLVQSPLGNHGFIMATMHGRMHLSYARSQVHCTVVCEIHERVADAGFKMEHARPESEIVIEFYTWIFH